MTHTITRRGLPLLGLVLLLVLAGASAARAAGPAAHAVLFYSPTCPHCHYVMDEVLTPLQARYGEQLVVSEIDVSQPGGQALYRAAIAAFAIPDERLGVPTLIVDSTVLVGSEEIPAQLPGLIDAALAAGGNSWPAIPGLESVTSAGAALPEVTPATSPFQRDPVANSVALVLLLAMAASVVVVAATTRPPFDRPLPAWQEQAIPLVALAGMAVAAYLAFVEVSGSEAVCGPVGDCNTVQQSPYARLFGVLPVGMLGVLGYAVILGVWAVRRFAGGQAARRAAVALPLLAFAGTLFSIYLTFLEPFVIGASCLWCLASAALMTALLWLTVPRGEAPIRRGRPRQRAAH